MKLSIVLHSLLPTVLFIRVGLKLAPPPDPPLLPPAPPPPPYGTVVVGLGPGVTAIVLFSDDAVTPELSSTVSVTLNMAFDDP